MQYPARLQGGLDMDELVMRLSVEMRRCIGEFSAIQASQVQESQSRNQANMLVPGDEEVDLQGTSFNHMVTPDSDRGAVQYRQHRHSQQAVQSTSSIQTELAAIRTALTEDAKFFSRFVPSFTMDAYMSVHSFLAK